MAGPTVAAMFALASAACWGVGIVVAKAALRGGVPPLTLAIVQLTASVAVFLAAALFVARRIIWPRTSQLSAASLSGVLEYGASYALAAFALSLTTVGNAAIIAAAEPALIVFIAALILRERAGLGLLSLLVLVSVGLALVVLPDLASTGAPRAGDLLMLASTGSGALYAVLCRRLVADIAPLPLSLLQQVAGLAALLAALGLASLAGWPEPGWALLAERPAAFALAAGAGLLYGAAVWLHLHALKRMRAGAFALFLALIPVFALVAAYLTLGEEITPTQVAGGVLIIAAAGLALRVDPSAVVRKGREPFRFT